MLICRFEGLATGLSDRVAEDSARFLSEETKNARTRFGKNALGL